MTLLDLLKGFWGGFLASLIVAYPIYKALLSLKSRQTVSQYAPESHQVKQGTPTMGGLIIIIGFLIAGPFLGILWPIWSLVLLYGVIGFVDDFVVPRMLPGKRGLGWKQKILMQVVVAASVAYSSGRGLTWAAVETFFILFFSNAYNFSDGLDGLAASLGVLFLLGIIGLGPGMMPMLAAAICIGAILPFSFMNAPKAKIFMGDVGSLPIGALMGSLVTACLYSFVSQTNYLGISAVVVLSFVMIAELVPVPLQIFWVKVFKRKLFLYTPIHHTFEKIGWPETRVVWCFALTQFLCVMAAWTLVAMN